MRNNHIIGRFAPSPTGSLHLGSLVCALASYLDIKTRGGRWLVRIEDIDPPREVAGASDQILRQLEAHGLCWNGGVLYQSTRLPAYQDIVADLQNKQLAYHCECTRKRLANLGGVYDKRCRHRLLPRNGNTTRLTLGTKPASVNFNDLVVGNTSNDLNVVSGDFVIKRRDGLFSYQLAVTVDDQFQGITHVMRGSDLLDSTAKQIYLQQCLSYRQPTYAHLPLVLNNEGQKLSKQTQATALVSGREVHNCWNALHWLQQSPPEELLACTLDDLHRWALKNWDLSKISKTDSAPSSSEF